MALAHIICTVFYCIGLLGVLAAGKAIDAYSERKSFIYTILWAIGWPFGIVFMSFIFILGALRII